MNWKYPTGLALAIIGSTLNATVWLILFGLPLYVLGVIIISYSGKPPKAKWLGILLPLLIPLILFLVLWLMSKLK